MKFLLKQHSELWKREPQGVRFSRSAPQSSALLKPQHYAQQNPAPRNCYSREKPRREYLSIRDFTFRVVDALLTNFHLPRSTLLALVCAFPSAKMYSLLIAMPFNAGYRFYSYGDCMLIR